MKRWLRLRWLLMAVGLGGAGYVAYEHPTEARSVLAATKEVVEVVQTIRSLLPKK